MKSFRSLLFLAMVFSASIQADEEAIYQSYFPQKGPWFTGPLLAPAGYAVPQGQVNLEPYLFYRVNNGRYNEHWQASSIPHLQMIKVEVQGKVGIVNGLDFSMTPSALYCETQGEHSINVGDWPFYLGVQIVRAKMSDPWPAIKLNIRALAPLGKYQKLNPAKLGTDGTGTGSWLPGAVLVFAKLWDLKKDHYLEGRLAFNYQFGTPVHIQGFSIYGGGYGTNGTAYHGNIFSIDSSVQYNLTQQLSLACDLSYKQRAEDRFSGNAGSVDGKPATVGRPSSNEFSLAPALEYSFNKNLGMIGGVWFSLAGRNTARFISGVVAMNIHI